MPAAAAPAKINLTLHILGRRADGYHEIESLVAFTELADQLGVEPADTLSLKVSGEFAVEAGEAESNLVMKAARKLQKAGNTSKGAAITLQKHIPVGAGLGGGSSDAATALRLLNDLWDLKFSGAQLHEIARTLGADVPMFLVGRPLIARGIGDKIELLEKPLPYTHAVLVHPRKVLATAGVYAAYTPSQVSGERNDLQRAAISVMPEVAEVLLALETALPKAALVRMSGSGACCYALYARAEDAAACAQAMRGQYLHWWVAGTTIQG